MKRYRVAWKNIFTRVVGHTDYMDEDVARNLLAKFVGQEDVRFEHWLELEPEAGHGASPQPALQPELVVA